MLRRKRNRTAALSCVAQQPLTARSRRASKESELRYECDETPDLTRRAAKTRVKRRG